VGNTTDPNGLPDGADIYDNSGKLIGGLDTANSRKGYLGMLKGIFFTKAIFLPMSAVDHTSLDGIHLILGTDELGNSRFETPP
jgi:hypothetical protein